jgi:RNA polymerase sigma-70 factor (ECF subfamily)
METNRPTLARVGHSAGSGFSAPELIEEYYERIYAFLRRLTANEADAADLTQRCFSRVWQALPGFGGRSSVSSWIHSIAYNAYVDWRRVQRPTEGRSAAWWTEQAAPGPRPDEIASQADLRTTVYAAVDKLEPDLRTSVHLHYYQELTLDETAEAMGVATSTVKYRLRLALGELQKQLAEQPNSKPSSSAKPL